LQTVDGRFGHC